MNVRLAHASTYVNRRPINIRWRPSRRAIRTLWKKKVPEQRRKLKYLEYSPSTAIRFSEHGVGRQRRARVSADVKILNVALCSSTRAEKHCQGNDGHALSFFFAQRRSFRDWAIVGTRILSQSRIYNQPTEAAYTEPRSRRFRASRRTVSRHEV